jgi:FixJ family two-component response regulator
VTNKGPKVFIVDDEPFARRGLTRLVRAAGIPAESFASARDFLESGAWEGPGCIVLDVKMPEMSGPDLQRELSEAEYCMPIIFISAHGDVSTTAAAMKMGAVDFLTKPVEREDLLTAIRDAFARDAVSREERAHIVSAKEGIRTLTAREHEIMRYMITGMLNKQIAAELGIAEITVKIHRGRVMQKLGIVSIVELVRMCEKAGVVPAGVSGAYGIGDGTRLSRRNIPVDPSESRNQ